MPIQITATDFNAKVLESKKLVLVDFWSPNCGPCELHSDELAKVKQQLNRSVEIFKVNVDEETQLADFYQVIAMPTTKVFKQGQCIKTVLGVQSEKNMLELIAALSDNKK